MVQKIILHFLDLLWCNRYYCHRCARRREFKFWTRVFTLRKVVILVKKLFIKLVSLQPCVNIWVNWLFYLGISTYPGEEKLTIKPVNLCWRNCLLSPITLAERLGKYIYIFILISQRFAQNCAYHIKQTVEKFQVLSYGIHIFSNLEISNNNLLKNIREI